MSKGSGGKDLDVLVFGEALVDFFADPHLTPLWEAPAFRPHLGGAPANLAIGLARLGARAALATLVGRDPFGRFVRERLAAAGVDVQLVGEHEAARTGVTFVAIDEHGERSFVFFRHPSADLCVTPEHVGADAVARARVTHVGSSTLAREPARAATWRVVDYARAAGRRVSCDVNFRARLWENPSEFRPLLARLLARCWVAKLSEEEIDPLLGTRDPEEACARVCALGAEIAIVTLGADGCVWASAGETGRLGAPHVEVVDTTGAGDAFMAALLAALLRGATLAEACASGNEFGARACTAVGATTALG